MYKLKLLEEADKEFEEAAAWYEEKSSGLGVRFIETVRSKLEDIREHPERNTKRKGNFREAVVRIFPYLIVNIFYKNNGAILVSSIFHTSRNPKRKYRRK